MVKKKLPREKKIKHLYEISMGEDEFIQKFEDFDFLLTDPEIEGIYETKISLLTKFVTMIGNYSKVIKRECNKETINN